MSEDIDITNPEEAEKARLFLMTLQDQIAERKKLLRMLRIHNFVEKLCEAIESELMRAEQEWKEQQG